LNALGKHLLIELYDCSPGALDSLETVSATMVEAANSVSATIINVAEHKFQPLGVSVVVMIAESHLSIHTWPEHGYAAVDLFTCSDTMSPSVVVDLIREAFGSKRVTTMEVHRGIIAPVLTGSSA
jgi:S-adenosylmethionine decarboxylase proenzyme